MKGKRRFFVCFICAAVFALNPAVFAHAQITIQDVQLADVTPSGFSVVWRTSEAADPGIAFYSDAEGTDMIFMEAEIIPFPLRGGDPEIVDEYQQENSREVIQNSSKQLGLMKITVRGLQPETAYYYRIYAEGDGGGPVWWPDVDAASVTTTGENAFVSDSKQLLITLVDQAGGLDATGWIVMASTVETLFPVSSFVGDGAGTNQTYVNLTQLFGPDGKNFTPIGTKEVLLTVIRGDSGQLEHTESLDFTESFFVSTVYPVTIDLSGIDDSDGDGLPDDIENAPSSCTDAFDADSDDDGLADGVEDKNQNGVVDPGETDPCNTDTDGDGIQDGTELGVTEPVPDPDGDGPLLGTDTDVFNPDDDPASNTDPLDGDSDDDGISDGSEDVDHNGSVDGWETDPNDPDTDGDGYDDGDELFTGSNPLNGYSYPGVTFVQLKEGFNMIAIPEDVTFTPDLLDWIPVFGGSMEIEKIMTYDAVAGAFVTVVPEDQENESHILQGGEGLIVYSLVDKQIEFATVLDSSLDLRQGFNLAGISCPPAGFSAFQLLSALGSENVSSIQRYDAEKGAFETAAFTAEGDLAGIDFPIVSGEGYLIFMRQEAFDVRF
jgi:hypothetical protein